MVPSSNIFYTRRLSLDDLPTHLQDILTFVNAAYSGVDERTGENVIEGDRATSQYIEAVIRESDGVKSTFLGMFERCPFASSSSTSCSSNNDISKQEEKIIGVVNIKGVIDTDDGRKDNNGHNGTPSMTMLDACCIQLLAIHPDYQNMGLGKMLMDSATEHARRMGFKTLVITVLEMKVQAHSWYQRLGFQEAGAMVFAPPPHIKVNGGKILQELILKRDL